MSLTEKRCLTVSSPSSVSRPRRGRTRPAGVAVLDRTECFETLDLFNAAASRGVGGSESFGFPVANVGAAADGAARATNRAAVQSGRGARRDILRG